MRIPIYRLCAWTKNNRLDFEFDFEFKDERYQEVKTQLKRAGYRVQELFAWS